MTHTPGNGSEKNAGGGAKEKLTSPLASYVHTRRAGGLIFVAGQGCRDPETNGYAGLTLHPDGTVAAYDIRAQTRGVLANIERALKAESCDRTHIIDVNVFLSDMKDFQAMNEVWNDFFANQPVTPTRTTVAVKQLPGLNFVEMKAIAALPGAN
jgi:enamine deaminase RidA (YjgF/YER057c/UK114 family)